MKSFLAWAAQPRIALRLTLGLALVVALVTLTPSQTLPPAPGSDKLHHFLAFGAVAFPIALARPHAFVWIVFAVSAYGAMIEAIQPYVGRQGDVMDALANSAGAIFGTTLGVLMRRALAK